MKPDAIEAASHLAGKVFRDIKVSLRDADDTARGFFWDAQSIGTLSEDGIRTYVRLLIDLRDTENLKDRVSLGFYMHEFNLLFANRETIVSDTTDWNQIIKELLVRAEQSIKEWNVYLPIFGVANSSVEPLRIGNVELVRITDEAFDDIEDIVDKPDYAGEEKSARKRRRMTIGAFSRAGSPQPTRLIGQTCLQVTVKCESGMAIYDARSRTEPVLHALTYFSSFNETTSAIPRIGFDVMASNETRVAVAVAPQRNEGHWLYDHPANQELLTLDTDFLETSRQSGFVTLNEILGKKQNNSFENVILTALKWFHQAVNSPQEENQFVNLVMVLESFLNPDGGERVSDAVSEGTALLLKKEYQARLLLKREMKDFYKVRSKIAHGSKPTLTELSQINDLRMIARDFLKEMIFQATDWRSLEDVRKHVELLKLS